MCFPLLVGQLAVWRTSPACLNPSKMYQQQCSCIWLSLCYWHVLFFSGCCYLALNLTYMLVWLRKGRVLAFSFCLLGSRHSGCWLCFNHYVMSDSWDSKDCSLPGSSVHGTSQARILEWVAFPSPGDLSNLGNEPGSPALKVDSLPTEPPGSDRDLMNVIAF